MANSVQEYRDLLAQADAETTRIAARIEELMKGVNAGMSEAEETEVKAGLQAVADKLKTVGVVAPDVTPVP